MVGAWALAALLCPALVADNVTDAIRAQLAIGDYAAALKAGDVKGTALTDDVRVLRSYARLAAAVEAEAEGSGKRLGATQAKLDLFDTQSSAISFPKQVTWADCRSANVKQLSRTRIRFTPNRLYNNYSFIESFFNDWDTGRSKDLNQINPADLQDSPMISFRNNSSKTQALSINDYYYYDDGYRTALLLFINGKASESRFLSGTALPFRIIESPLSKSDYYNSAGYLNLYLNYERNAIIFLEPGDTLTIYINPRARDNTIDISLPTGGVTIHNGKYPEVSHSILASKASSAEAFTALGNLTKNAIDSSIADLLAVKTGHSLTLTGEESISCFSTVIEEADRKAWVGVLKLIKAASQLNTAYNLAAPIGGTQLFDGSLNLLNILNNNPDFLKLGTMPAKTRAALLTLIGEAITQLEQAADLGLITRDRLPTAEYLFNDSQHDQDNIKFTKTSTNGISLSNSFSRNKLIIQNTSRNDQELTFNLDPAGSSYDQFYGYFTTSTTFLGTSDVAQDEFWFSSYLDESGVIRVSGSSNSGTLNCDSQSLRVTVPARSSVMLGADAEYSSNYLYIYSSKQFEVGKLGFSLQGSLPSGVTLSVTPDLTNTQYLKEKLNLARQALTATGAALDQPLLGENPKVSLAPLFAAKPVVLRDQLPKFVESQGQIQIKAGTSANLVTKSGLLLGVVVPSWEEFIQDQGWFNIHMN